MIGDTLSRATIKSISTVQSMLTINCCAKRKVQHRQSLPELEQIPATLCWLMLESLTQNNAFEA